MSCAVVILLLLPLSLVGGAERCDDPDHVGSQALLQSAKRVIVGTSAGAESARPVEFGCSENVAAETTFSEQKCPSACPFWAESDHKAPACTFQCVRGSECGSGDSNPNASIPDIKHRYCRRCSLMGCKRCSPRTVSTESADEGNDIRLCHECWPGYELVGGACRSKLRYLWHSFITIVCVVIVVLLAWFIQLIGRPVVSGEALQYGLRCRDRSKSRLPRHHFARRLVDKQEVRFLHNVRHFIGEGGSESMDRTFRKRLWPLSTNLFDSDCEVSPGGPGLMLHFHFQLGVIIWASTMLLMWVAMGLFVDWEFFTLGTLHANTPRQMCQVVAHGYRLQHRLAARKMQFLIAAYVLTFAMVIWHAVLQRRRFDHMVKKSVTLGSFTLMAIQLPILSGSECWEAKIKEAIEEQTEESVADVSICWDYSEHVDIIADLFEHLKDETAKSSALARSSPQISCSEVGESREGDSDCKIISDATCSKSVHTAHSRIFGAVDYALGYGGDQDRRDPKVTREQASQLLASLKCSGSAFVVFHTESARDSALETAHELPGGGVSFQGQIIPLVNYKAEPKSVLWQNFRLKHLHVRDRILLGLFYMLFAVFLWTVLVYLPYAYFVLSYHYANGSRPSFLHQAAFTLLVAGGNQFLYFVCATLADNNVHRFQHHRELTYCLTYVFACSVNVIVDALVTACITYKELVGLNARTYGGVLLKDLPSWIDVAKSYPMQKALGEALRSYAFPGIFLLPFILEPVFAIFLPRYLNVLLVRSREGISHLEAARKLRILFPMDLSRYADILLNVIVATLVFAVPGGFVLPMFAVLVASHTYILVYDQYRVLRCVPEFVYSANTTDHWMQYMMILPCGMMAGILAMQVQYYLWQGASSLSFIGLGCTLAFWCHALLHGLLLHFLVPALSDREEEEECADLRTLSYNTTAADYQNSWLTANPVHCLRLRYVYNDTFDLDRTFRVSTPSKVMASAT